MQKKEKILMTIAIVLLVLIAALGWVVKTRKAAFEPIANEKFIKINNTIKTSVTVLPAPENEGVK